MIRPVGDAILNGISERHDALSNSIVVDESSPVSFPLSLLI